MSSRKADALVFAILALMIAATSGRLAVYHRVTVTEITVIRLAPGVPPRALPTPQQFQKTYYAASAHRIMMAHIEDGIVDFMADADRPYHTPEGSTVRWIVRYGDNTTHLDRELVMDFEGDSGRRQR